MTSTSSQGVIAKDKTFSGAVAKPLGKSVSNGKESFATLSIPEAKTRNSIKQETEEDTPNVLLGTADAEQDAIRKNFIEKPMREPSTCLGRRDLPDEKTERFLEAICKEYDQSIKDMCWLQETKVENGYELIQKCVKAYSRYEEALNEMYKIDCEMPGGLSTSIFHTEIVKPSTSE